MDNVVSQYKRQAIKAAKNLLYGDKVIEKIKNAKTEGEIDRIMKAARHEHFK